jgi:hypothetical protein
MENVVAQHLTMSIGHAACYFVTDIFYLLTDTLWGQLVSYEETKVCCRNSMAVSPSSILPVNWKLLEACPAFPTDRRPGR